jgi:site-specific recombinase XerD
MFLSEAIEDFAGYARAELGHTAATIWTYRSRQRHFAGWLEANGLPDPPVHELTAPLIRRYTYSLTAQNLRPRSIRGALNAIRALFSYLCTMGALSDNPALEVKLPRKDAAQRLLVSDEELLKLLSAAERQRTEFRCVRDHALLSVLIFCGLRRQEFLDLTVHCVNLDDRSLIVQRGKGGKSRTIYLCEEAHAALRAWLAIRQTLKCKTDGLFVTENRRRLGERSLVSVLEDVKAIAGFKGDPRIKPHSIRHAAATRLMRNGADIRSIQTWLGHAHLQTTAVYLHTDEEQVRKIAPLAGFQTSETSLSPPENPSTRIQGDRRAFYRSRRSARR